MRSANPLLVPVLLALTLIAPPTVFAGEGVDVSSPDAVKKALSAGDAGIRLAAARAARTMQSAKLTAPLVKLLKDDEREVRSAAIASLATRESAREKKTAARGLAARLPGYLKEGADEDEHARVVGALHDLAQPISIKPLLDFPPSTDGRIVKARARAVANVPCAEAIEALIQLGSRGRRGAGYRDVTRDALAYAAGVKLTRDPDAWRRWWREVKRDFDFEAAAAERARVRAEAAERKRRKEEQRDKRQDRKDRKRRRDEEKDEADA